MGDLLSSQSHTVIGIDLWGSGRLPGLTKASDSTKINNFKTCSWISDHPSFFLFFFFWFSLHVRLLQPLISFSLLVLYLFIYFLRFVASMWMKVLFFCCLCNKVRIFHLFLQKARMVIWSLGWGGLLQMKRQQVTPLWFWLPREQKGETLLTISRYILVGGISAKTTTGL